MIKKNDKIFLAGHNGLVGSAILKALKKKKYKKIITENRKKLDLFNQIKVVNYLKKIKPKIVIIAAAKVGGIKANNLYRADFIRENIQIQTNLIHACHLNNINNIIFLGSSCVYPKLSKLPIKESYLLDGKLENTNEPYAIAKIAGIKMCESYNYQYRTNFKCLMPCNLYGQNDNYDLTNSHFFPALIKKIYLAKKKKRKKILVWGTGKPKRELMHVDDMADACIYFFKKKTKETLINIGIGKDRKIIEYVNFLKRKMKFKGKIAFDKSKPDGTMRKLIDTSIARKYGWKAKISLSKGFELTYRSFLDLNENN